MGLICNSKLIVVSLAILLFSCALPNAFANESRIETPSINNQLDDLATLIDRKLTQRRQLEKSLVAGTKDPETEKKLDILKSDIAKLNETFQLLVMGVTDSSLHTGVNDISTNWQQDVLEILHPLLESLKSVTEKPREIADLRESIGSIDTRLNVIDAALDGISSKPYAGLESGTEEKVRGLLTSWEDQRLQLQQERLVAEAQLQSLEFEDVSAFQALIPATKHFLLGRGLTLLLVLVVAVLTWLLMRSFFWAYTRFFTTKDLRRNNSWYRLADYSYHFLTFCIVVLSVLSVLYFREDLLLLALSFLLIMGAALSLKQFLPRYLSEARLLLNLGGVREDERIVYDGLPWQVMSINIYSVLRNPALDGVVRLPISELAALVSRPVKNKLWFPTNTGDFVILPSGFVGQIKHQTPDLVEITLRGGMTQTYRTADFYAMEIVNLSRDKTFGVSVNFGLDYSLQTKTLTDVPKALYQGVETTLKNSGYGKQIDTIVCELATANTSSLDFLVFVTLKSSVAQDYLKLERLVIQACVAVCNENNWTIPFPQLTIHNSSPSTNLAEVA